MLPALISCPVQLYFPCIVVQRDFCVRLQSIVMAVPRNQKRQPTLQFFYIFVFMIGPMTGLGQVVGVPRLLEFLQSLFCRQRRVTEKNEQEANACRPRPKVCMRRVSFPVCVSNVPPCTHAGLSDSPKVTQNPCACVDCVCVFAVRFE
jgi:hypothetical protein